MTVSTGLDGASPESSLAGCLGCSAGRRGGSLQCEESWKALLLCRQAHIKALLVLYFLSSGSLEIRTESLFSLLSQLPPFQESSVVKVSYYLYLLLPCCDYTIPMDTTSTKGSLVRGLTLF